MKRTAFCMMVLTLVLSVSCVRDSYDDAMLQKNDVSMTMNGREIFSFNPLTCQMSYNKAKREFRVFTDNMSDYFMLTLDSFPSKVGDSVKGTLEWTTDDDLGKQHGIFFSLEQTDAMGRLWLWNSDQKIFVIVQQI